MTQSRKIFLGLDLWGNRRPRRDRKGGAIRTRVFGAFSKQVVTVARSEALRVPNPSCAHNLLSLNRQHLGQRFLSASQLRAMGLTDAAILTAWSLKIGRSRSPAQAIEITTECCPNAEGTSPASEVLILRDRHACSPSDDLPQRVSDAHG